MLMNEIFDLKENMVKDQVAFCTNIESEIKVLNRLNRDNTHQKINLMIHPLDNHLLENHRSNFNYSDIDVF